MSPEERSQYFGHRWPAACKARGWRVKDDVRRRHETGVCMAAIRAEFTESVSGLGHDEVSALFCYLDFLAHPGDLKKSANWLDCQQDYRAYNRARQADWHERKTYGGRGHKLRKNRFKGQASARGEAFDPFDPAEIRKRHLTMRTRHEKKHGYKPKKQQPGDLRFVAIIDGRPLVGPEPVKPAKPAPVPAGNAEDNGNPF